MATIEFFGAVGEVTGSCYLLRTDRAAVLSECGMVQGGDDEGARNARPFPFDIDEIDAVVLSHAHIDHSARLPLLVKRGYAGPVYTHEATAELCDIMLRDAAWIQEKEAEWENRRREKKNGPPVEPLYSVADAEAVLGSIRGVPYASAVEVADG